MPCATSTKIKERDIMSNLTRKELIKLTEATILPLSNEKIFTAEILFAVIQANRLTTQEFLVGARRHYRHFKLSAIDSAFENSSYLVLKDQIAALTWVKEKIPITLRFSAKMLAQFRRSLLPSLPSKVCSKK